MALLDSSAGAEPGRAERSERLDENGRAELAGPPVPDESVTEPLATSAALDATERNQLLRRSGAADLHESLAGLLAARGEYESAYRHLRMALNILRDIPRDGPYVPEQLRAEVAQLRREHAEALQQSMRDGLTDTYNRRYLERRLRELVGERQRCRGGIAFALIDLDWFKDVNDTYGHAVGDLVLQRVVDLLQRDLPAGAFCARYGGEEFVLVLPDTGSQEAVALAESARARIEQYAWGTIAPGLRVTVSVGLRYQAPGEGLDGQGPLRSADRLLYMAKRAGRNTLAFSDGRVTSLRHDGALRQFR